MALPQDDIRRLGDELYGALRERRTVPPLTGRVAGIGVDDSYAISLHMLRLREQAGERLVGKKIGVTSKPVQDMLDVRTPDFGFLTDVMAYASGAEMPISTRLIQPRAEGELAFRLARGLRGPGVTEADVLAATECVMPCFEVVDSRIRDWKIRIQDTVADNASCGLFVLGDAAVSPRSVDLTTCGMAVYKNGALLSTGAGAAALGSPIHCVRWLANTLGAFDIPLKAGEVILSGSLVPLEPVVAGDVMHLEIGGIGAASVRFT